MVNEKIQKLASQIFKIDPLIKHLGLIDLEGRILTDQSSASSVPIEPDEDRVMFYYQVGLRRGRREHFNDVYASSPNCVDNETCYSPSELTTLAGNNVTWSNDSGVIHTVTSGNPLEGPDGTFDSSIIMSGDTFSHTFTEAGNYQYFCTIHPWMTGTVIVG